MDWTELFVILRTTTTPCPIPKYACCIKCFLRIIRQFSVQLHLLRGLRHHCLCNDLRKLYGTPLKKYRAIV